MRLTPWLRTLQVLVTRGRPAQQRKRNRWRPSVEHLEGRLAPAATPLTVVYVESNNPNPGQNSILAYRSDPMTDALTPLGTYLTRGTGTPNPTEGLGPDDSDQEVVVSRDHKFLFAVNS